MQSSLHMVNGGLLFSFYHELLSVISSGSYPTTVKYNSALCDGDAALETSISS